MRTQFLFSFFLLLSLQLTASSALSLTAIQLDEAAISVEEVSNFPIFGKKRKTSNKKQLKFAAKRSRRNGKGVMRARKNRGKNNGRSVKGGHKGRGGSKKKEGCNT